MDCNLNDSSAFETEIVARLGGGDEIDRLARQHRAFLRARNVGSAVSLLRLALLYGPGGGSLRATAALSSLSGIAEISDVALLERLCNCGDWLAALCSRVIAAAGQGVAAGGDDRPLRIIDGTRLEGPGKRALRLHLVFDLAEARLSDALLSGLDQAEKLTRIALKPGEIRIGDRCYARPDDIAAVLGQGADILIRTGWEALRYLDLQGQAFDMASFLAKARSEGQAEAAILVGKARAPKTWQPPRLRLVAIAKPPEARETSRRKARRASAKNGNRIDQRTLDAAECLLLLASLPAEDYPPERLYALYRLRWQIELAIKRLKSILDLNRMPAKHPKLQRTWVLAHLLIALMIETTRSDLAAFPP